MAAKTSAEKVAGRNPVLRRRTRANGEESRRRILDAAAEVAGERGYEGTSIALVSEKCGLPASSIYWHFENKDDLIAAVIERSFDIWLDVLVARRAASHGPGRWRGRRSPRRCWTRPTSFASGSCSLRAPPGGAQRPADVPAGPGHRPADSPTRGLAPSHDDTSS